MIGSRVTEETSKIDARQAVKEFRIGAATVPARPLECALYLVATPIGNLGDISLHALAVLRRADWVCAEDTRVTQQLLGAYGIQARLLSVREHNERQMTKKSVPRWPKGWW